MFVCALFAALALYIAANVAADAFGVFGDGIFNWYSFDMTNNPRVAKIAYLDRRYGEYDSYILGCSSAAAYPTAELNEYLGAEFYNLFAYGCDVYDIEQTARYAIAHYNVRNLVINLGLTEGDAYQVGSEDHSDELHAKTDGTPLLPFYLRYALKNYKYPLSKLRGLSRDTWLPQTFDVFNAENGEYDKRARDVEHIGDTDAYFQANPIFMTKAFEAGQLRRMDEAAESLGRIKALCDENGVNAVFIFPPIYRAQLDAYSPELRASYFTRLAQAVDFWDFSDTSVSDDARYFYDTTHFRNDTGRMVLARVFGDEGVYTPEAFGALVTRDNVAEYVERFTAPRIETAHTAKLPIFLYHDIAPDGTPAALFEAHIRALSEAGYTSVDFNQVEDYVYRGVPLPDKPVCITFDDGYLSNYTQAFPILEKYGFKATIFVIGVSVGSTETYKDTGYPITPHFSWAQAREMMASGLVSIQSHTYDMHQHDTYDGGDPRLTVLARAGERENDYIAAFDEDCRLMREAFIGGLGYAPTVAAYPRGVFDTRSEALLRAQGIRVTLGTQPLVNELVKGLPPCLFGMYRIPADGVSAQELLKSLADTAAE
jgi:peptidoglycan/xylan/chitin deacetylase (PgdA/CDA1 family)